MSKVSKKPNASMVNFESDDPRIMDYYKESNYKVARGDDGEYFIFTDGKDDPHVIYRSDSMNQIHEFFEAMTNLQESLHMRELRVKNIDIGAWERGDIFPVVGVPWPKAKIVAQPTVKFFAMPGASMPEYKTPGSAGADVRAHLFGPEVIMPGQIKMISTGLFSEIPEGYEIQVRSRSGLAAKHGVFVLNSPGTIDSDYRGEIKVILANMGEDAHVVHPDERIAQLVVAKCEQMTICQLDSQEFLSDTDRGEGGFGSTGVK